MAAVLTRFRLDLDEGEEKGSFSGAEDELASDRRNARFIWATRGRTWGFRFLRKGGLVDPLGVYEATFSKVGDQPEAWRRVADKVALRFPDPDGRRGRGRPSHPTRLRPLRALGRWDRLA